MAPRKSDKKLVKEGSSNSKSKKHVAGKKKTVKHETKKKRVHKVHQESKDKKPASLGKPGPGDSVEVHLSKVIYEGSLLQSPDSEKNILLLKLDSGYNIGLNRKDIVKVVTKKKFHSEKKEAEEIKRDNSKPNIAMIITGGTIASKLDPKTGGVDPLTNPEDFFRFYPALFEKVNVVKVEIPFMKFSENMDYKDWQSIAKTAEKLLNDSNIKGVIISHGTDFLHYTSAALSFFLRNLTKPVVLTYSQRSIDRASSDANLNLQCAALASVSDLAEVMIVGHGSSNDDFCYAMPGTKVRKLHSSRRDAFKTVNAEPFAKIYPGTIQKISSHNVRKKGKVKLDNKFEEKVALVKFYPGQNPNILDYYVRENYKGIVIEFAGIGQVAASGSRNSWVKKLRDIQSKGIIVCAAAQTIFGKLDPYIYSSGREVFDTGVIYLEDMMAETALVKLGWVLGHPEWTKSKEKVKEKMLQNFAGELNPKLEFER